MVWTAYGPPDVLRLAEVDDPAPGDGDVLIAVRATTVNAGDIEIRRFAFRNVLTIPLRLFFGIRKPRKGKTLGQEVAGEVVAVGKDVSRFQVGDRVFAHMGLRFGGYAEFAVVPERGQIAPIPEGVSYENAATIPTAGMYAQYFIREAAIVRGQSVLVNGGGGAIGSYTIQLAKLAGAEVTGVDRTEKLDLMTRLGADSVIDFTKEDFTERAGEFDLILDVVDKSWFHRAAPALRPGGRYLHSNISLLRAIQTRWSPHRRGRSAKFVSEGNDDSAMEHFADMIRSGQIEAVIDRRYPLAEIVSAHEYAESGLKQGHIVIMVP